MPDIAATMRSCDTGRIAWPRCFSACGSLQCFSDGRFCRLSARTVAWRHEEPSGTKKNGRLEKAGGDSGDDEDSGDEDEEDDDNDGDDDDDNRIDSRVSFLDNSHY